MSTRAVATPVERRRFRFCLRWSSGPALPRLESRWDVLGRKRRARTVLRTNVRPNDLGPRAVRLFPLPLIGGGCLCDGVVTSGGVEDSASRRRSGGSGMELGDADEPPFVAS